jgi:hypothetical protein
MQDERVGMKNGVASSCLAGHPSGARKPWRTPLVIRSAIEQQSLNTPGLQDDGPLNHTAPS